MSWEAILTLAVLGATVIALAWPRMPPEFPLLGALAILAVTGCVPLDRAFVGFANPGLIAVAALYVVAAGLQHTGAVSAPARWLFGHSKRLWVGQLRIMLPTAAVSAFINNTPVVAALLPAVLDWGKRRRFAASRLAMPLSFAAMLGGTCTLIGTSTIVIVNGLLVSATDGPGMGFFTIGAVGLPVAVAGILYVLIFGRSLLPDRGGVMGELTDPREYTVEMRLSPGSPLAGQSLETAGLRHLPGLYVVEIERDGGLITAPGPEELLQENDRLVFAGIVESVADLQKMRGLVPATGQVFKLDTPRPDRRLIETVIAPENPVVGRTVREGGFRSRYGAVVIAVARRGRRIGGKIGSITLESGDTLLLEAPAEFLRRYLHSREFLLLRPLQGSVQPHYERAWIAWLIMGAVIGLVTTRVVPLAPAAVFAAVAMVATRCIGLVAARRSIDLQVLLVIGSAFAIAGALDHTGAAAIISTQLLNLAAGSAIGLLAAVYGVTAILTNFISHNAAAVLMFPLTLAAAAAIGQPLLPYAIAIAMAASVSFATPISYQTNLMVYGPGGYRFSDFVRFGLPLNVLVGIVSVVVIYFVWLVP
ncbi:MAG: SLC13 family permease [Gammaproteobacteria bacterium]|nr:SLC13 family permease [Gammaproteobacteria bacterium]